jgi:hypothetical protein
MAITLGLGVTYHDTSVETSGKSPTRAIFGYGYDGSPGGRLSVTNLVNNYGGVSTDTTGVGTVRWRLAAAGYGGDKAIFGYGETTTKVSMTNLVSNTGIVSGDVTGVGSARTSLAAACYGGDKAIFGYGNLITGDPTRTAITNLVSNIGVVATDTTGIGTGRHSLAAAGYGGDKAIFGYGDLLGGALASMTNLVSNTGVVATDTTGVGTAREELAAAGYGGDKAIFGFGYTTSVTSITNLVSNTGVVATDTTNTFESGKARTELAAAGYGGDKAIFGYGATASPVNTINLVSNTGILSSNVTGVGTARRSSAAASYSS